jgi:uncharacterized DUF497 family protein
MYTLTADYVLINYIWDEKKYAANLEKHGIRFEEAKDVFADKHALEAIDDEHSFYGEQRILRIGISLNKGVLFVIFCEYEEIDSTSIRIISARKATKRETIYYFNVR